MARIQEASGCTAGSSLAAMQEPCSCSHHGAGGMALTAAMPVHEKGKGGRSGVRAPLTCSSPTHADVQLLVVLGMVVNRGRKDQNSVGIFVWKSVIKCMCTVCTLLSKTITSISASA